MHIAHRYVGMRVKKTTKSMMKARTKQPFVQYLTEATGYFLVLFVRANESPKCMYSLDVNNTCCYIPGFLFVMNENGTNTRTYRAVRTRQGGD